MLLGSFKALAIAGMRGLRLDKTTLRRVVQFMFRENSISWPSKVGWDVADNITSNSIQNEAAHSVQLGNAVWDLPVIHRPGGSQQVR